MTIASFSPGDGAVLPMIFGVIFSDASANRGKMMKQLDDVVLPDLGDKEVVRNNQLFPKIFPL